MDSSLRKRWQTAEGRERAEKATGRLLSSRGLDGLGLGEVDGRVDLRGLPAPIPRRQRRFDTAGWFAEELGGLVQLQGVRLEHLDFSGAQLQSLRFRDSQIVDCLFEGANCRDWRLWGAEVSGCGFRKADLREAAVGTWHEGRRNAWRGVDFSGADFRVAVSWMAIYEDCDFSGAKLAKVKFEQCALTRCRFAGELRKVVFDGRDLTDRPAPPSMDKVDFSGATFHQVEFMGFDLGSVALPNDPDIRLLRRARCAARRGVEILDGDDRMEARILRAMLENQLRGPGTDHEARVLNRRDYVELGGAHLWTLAEDVLARAEADCLS
jgi:uncharacterized protein YjbI with pentapeptide repeats